MLKFFGSDVECLAFKTTVLERFTALLHSIYLAVIICLQFVQDCIHKMLVCVCGKYH